MSVVQIPNLPQAIAVSGAELIEIVQNGVSCRISLTQLLSAYVGAGVTQKQMRGWLASNGVPSYIYAVDFACPADIANQINIQWLHGANMVSGDPLYVFIETTLGFSSAQMNAAYIAMGSYPA